MSEGRLLAWFNNVAAGQDVASQGHSVSWAPHLVLVRLQVLPKSLKCSRTGYL